MREQKEIILSQSLNGAGIVISTVPPEGKTIVEAAVSNFTKNIIEGETIEGTLVHESLSSLEYSDKVTLFASSISTKVVDLVIKVGDSIINLKISPTNNSFSHPILTIIIQGGESIKAFVSEADVITIFGSVSRFREII
jgi:hypothetical protein